MIPNRPRGTAAFLVLAAAFSGSLACSPDGPAGPASAARSTVRSSAEHVTSPPSTPAPQGNAVLLRCDERAAATATALVGAPGGVIAVGRNYLIIPAGALDRPVWITATVSPDTVAAVSFEPSGLLFRRAAGLILDASGCDSAGTTPEVVYIDDDGQILERIRAVYSPWWHAVAAPISHFSSYAIAL